MSLAGPYLEPVLVFVTYQKPDVMPFFMCRAYAFPKYGRVGFWSNWLIPPHQQPTGRALGCEGQVPGADRETVRPP